MKALTGRQQAAVLLALVRDWTKLQNSKVCRVVIRSREFVSDERIRTALRWLCVCGGDWTRAKAEIKSPALVAWVEQRRNGGIYPKGGAR